MVFVAGCVHEEACQPLSERANSDSESHVHVQPLLAASFNLASNGLNHNLNHDVPYPMIFD